MQQPTAGPATAKVLPDIALQQTARSFTVSNGKTNAWLDDMLKPAAGKARKANAWSIHVKRPTLH
ncbi:MAG: hypothetical protein WA825_15010 [Steroidobacteraceae bacterium]